MKNAGQIMDADVETVSPEDDARAAIDLLAKTDHGAVAVVDEDRKVVGIVSESDLILSEEESDLHLPHYLNIMGGIVFVGSMKGFEKRLEKAFATKVSELMTADPITVKTYENADRVAKKIADKHHNHLPVVDDDGRLAGMVTRADALAAIVDDEDDSDSEAS
jgi:CBS domain-containing protein